MPAGNPVALEGPPVGLADCGMLGIATFFVVRRRLPIARPLRINDQIRIRQVRVIDDEGKPRVGLELNSVGPLSTGRFDGMTPAEEGVLPENPRIGRDGKFRIEGLVPGLKYGASASEGVMFQGDVFRDVIVAPGEFNEPGTLNLS